MSNKLFNNLAKLAPSIADAASDCYDGEGSKGVDLAVRRDLHRYIIPSTLNHLRAADRRGVVGSQSAMNAAVREHNCPVVLIPHANRADGNQTHCGSAVDCTHLLVFISGVLVS